MVEDALFCHRCGKAQRNLIEAEDPTSAADSIPVSAMVAPAVSVAVPVGFSNSVAVRLCFLVASVASVLDAMPAVQLLCVVWSICAGFIAVMLYRRATGRAMNIRDGAKMGWMTGVLNSLILTVLMTISIASNSAELSAALREQMRMKAPNDAATRALLDNPYVLASGILLTLLVIFIIITGACVAGGALGARTLRDNRAPDHQPR